MAHAKTEPADYAKVAAGTVAVWPLKNNARPVCFAPWPEPAVEPAPPAKKSKRKKKR